MKYLIKNLNSQFNLFTNCVSKRYFYHKNKAWPNEYNYEIAKNIEDHWRPLLENCHLKYQNNNEIRKNLPKKYILSMFPYPSGRLHLGHVRVYTLSDVLARYYRMSGFNVIHPIGWDSFGLPAENAALERNVKPQVWTDSNIEYMKNQLKELTFSFDWNRELSTCNKNYYKWTQHLFLDMFYKGIVMQKEALVNWDPVDKTVLANEQIDDQGRSWRSGSIVEKKLLKQWFIKSSAYAKSLLNSMKDLNTEDWDLVKNIQRMWIGNINGCYIDFDLKFESNGAIDSNELKRSKKISVFTQTPYAINAISHITISKHHILLKNNISIDNKKLKCYAINPLDESHKIPIFLNDDDNYFGVLNANGIPYLDSILGIPSLNETDREFALRNNLKINEINLNDNKTNEEANKIVRDRLIQLSSGGYETSDRLNDWCISRQRYWGTPIPLIYCDNCNVVPVPYDQLPVELPTKENFDQWLNTTCPKCNSPTAKRESDTMDTFMDSSWYYLRYLDVNNQSEPFDSKIAHKQMPVDVYIGGIEHAMTHLFVSRLISHFLYDQNRLPCKEPFKRFVAMGMVKGETFKTLKQGRYVKSSDVREEIDTKVNNKVKYYCRHTSEELNKDFEKMSKSKMNGIDPQFMIQQYGVDFTRLFLLSFVHPKSDRNFLLSQDMISGTLNTLQKIWGLVASASQALKNNQILSSKNDYSRELYKTRNSQLSMLSYNLNENFNLPSYLVAISKILKTLRNIPSTHYDLKFYQLLVEMLVIFSPVIPHFTNECWSKLKQEKNFPNELLLDKNKEIVELDWPKIDSDWPADLSFKLNQKQLFKMNITQKDLNELDENNLDKAISLLSQNERFVSLIKNRSLNEFKHSLYVRPFLNATLNFTDLKKSK